jgi:hypothetical protein
LLAENAADVKPEGGGAWRRLAVVRACLAAARDGTSGG